MKPLDVCFDSAMFCDPQQLWVLWLYISNREFSDGSQSTLFLTDTDGNCKFSDWPLFLSFLTSNHCSYPRKTRLVRRELIRADLSITEQRGLANQCLPMRLANKQTNESSQRKTTFPWKCALKIFFLLRLLADNPFKATSQVEFL